MERAGAGNTISNVASVADDVAEKITTAYSTVEVCVDIPDIALDIDRDLCRYALEQLVENAVEHNDSESPHVELTGSTTDSGIQIVVADNGPGIPKAEVDVISAGTERDLAHGSGLGLWGANWAIQTAGGSLAFESSRLGGTAVVVELPGKSGSTTSDG